MGYTAGIHDSLRTTALVFGAGHAILGPELEGNADHLIPLFNQDRSCRRRIDTTTHANDHSIGSKLTHGIHGPLPETLRVFSMGLG